MSLHSLLRTPLSVPLVWQHGLRKWAPEIAAVVVYLIASLAALILVDSSGRPWVDGAAWGCLVAAGVMTFVPLGGAAGSLASERQMGTLDALILTPVDRRRLVWGRYWNCAVPWARFIAWLLPLYVVLFLSRPTGEPAGNWVTSPVSATLCGLGARPALGYMILEHGEQIALRRELQALCVAVRALRDFVTLLLVCAIGLYCSARARTRAGAMGAALIAVPVLVGGVLSAPEWLIVGRVGLPGVEDLGAVYFFWSVVTVIVELLVALRLAGSVARNFDRFLLHEEVRDEA